MDTSLIIKVDDIREPRQAFVRPLSRAWLEETFAQAPQWQVRDATQVDARLTKVSARNVLLEASTRVSLTSPCRRCLREVDSEHAVEFTLSLVDRPDKHADKQHDKQHADKAGKRAEKRAAGRREEDDGEGELGSSFDDDADEERFDGEKVDLSPLMREQVLLALPSTEPLCNPGCLGLCATCGQNLNEGDCGHGKGSPDPRWSALKNVKLTH